MKRDDPKCPKGFRLLIQLFDVATEDDAKALVRKTFGNNAADSARFVEGTTRPANGADYSSGKPWVKANGFRVYVPSNFHV